VANIVKLLRFARIIGLPVIVAEQTKLGPTVAPIHDELQGVTPSTRRSSAVGVRGLLRGPGGAGRGALILTGIEAHICIAQTALQPSYLRRPCRRRRRLLALGPRLRHRLERLRQAGAVVTSTEMLMYELLAQAGTDEFRKVLELVKGG